MLTSHDVILNKNELNLNCGGEKEKWQSTLILSASNIQTAKEIIFPVSYISCLIFSSQFFRHWNESIFSKSYYYLYIISNEMLITVIIDKLQYFNTTNSYTILYLHTFRDLGFITFKSFTYQFSSKSLRDIILKCLIHYYITYLACVQ